jgi:hypothetical protein
MLFDIEKLFEEVNDPRLDCYSACNFDPLGGGIGVEN